MRWSQHLPRPRPPLLLPDPDPLEVELRQGVPARLRGRRGGWARVQRVRGPERLEGDWWKEQPFARDYWVVELDRGTGWIYREGGAWYLHGWF